MEPSPDVVEEGDRIYGDGINIAVRVEGLAEGGGICISGTVYDSIKNKLSLGYESMGEQREKVCPFSFSRSMMDEDLGVFLKRQKLNSIQQIFRFASH